MQNVINKTKNNQLITAGIKVSCKCKRSLYILRKTTNSPIIRAFGIKYAAMLQKVIRKAKNLYYDELIKTSGNKNKTLQRTFLQNLTWAVHPITTLPMYLINIT
jgi:hypothetical protein